MSPRWLLLTAALLAPVAAEAAPRFFTRPGPLVPQPRIARPIAKPAAPPRWIKPMAGATQMVLAPAEIAPHASSAPSGAAQPVLKLDHVVDSMHASYENLLKLAEASSWRAINQSVSVFRDAMKEADSASKALSQAKTPEEAATLRLRALTAYSVASRAAGLRQQLHQSAPHMQGGSEQARIKTISTRLGVPVNMMEQAYNEALIEAGGEKSMPVPATANHGPSNGSNPAQNPSSAMFTHSAFRTVGQNAFAPPPVISAEAEPR